MSMCAEDKYAILSLNIPFNKLVFVRNSDSHCQISSHSYCLCSVVFMFLWKTSGFKFLHVN